MNGERRGIRFESERRIQSDISRVLGCNPLHPLSTISFLMSPSQALAFKEQGNVLFKSAHFQQ